VPVTDFPFSAGHALDVNKTVFNRATAPLSVENTTAGGNDVNILHLTETILAGNQPTQI
jgi:hypothetical protein